jgi:membrane protease YdiL (CAAX protease family)
MLKPLTDVLNLRPLYSGEQWKPTIILLLSAFLPALHRSFGSLQFANSAFPFFGEFEAAVFMFTAAFALMGVLPVLVVRFVFKEPLRDYGLNVGDWGKYLPVTLILFLIIAVVFIYPASRTAEMRAAFPFDKHIGDSISSFATFELMRGLLFYTAWEFFFRGFMLFGLQKYLGTWIAVCVQTVPSCLWHIGMPSGELFSSIVAGIMFGILAIRSNSIVYVVILHYAIGLILDFFIVMAV